MYYKLIIGIFTFRATRKNAEMKDIKYNVTHRMATIMIGISELLQLMQGITTQDLINKTHKFSSTQH